MIVNAYNYGVKYRSSRNQNLVDNYKMVLCTKLVQWLSVAALVLLVWLVLLSEVLPLHLTPQFHDAITPVSCSVS